MERILSRPSDMIGNEYIGKINKCLIEVIDVKNDPYYNVKTVLVKDIKTSKVYEYGYEAFNRLLLNEHNKTM